MTQTWRPAFVGFTLDVEPGGREPRRVQGDRIASPNFIVMLTPMTSEISRRISIPNTVSWSVNDGSSVKSRHGELSQRAQESR